MQRLDTLPSNDKTENRCSASIRSDRSQGLNVWTRPPKAPQLLGPLQLVKHLFSFFPHPWKLRYAPYLVRTTSNVGRDLSDNTESIH